MALETLIREKGRSAKQARFESFNYTEYSDADLLMAVAKHRANPAFSELYGRYERHCYNLAMRIAGDRDLAHEAVQDAMLRIWTSAGTFNPGNAGGSARGWILKILANCCLKLVNKNASNRRREAQTVDELHMESNSQASASNAEIFRALQEAVGRLPVVDRRLVALYYGCELTQEEIGRQLAMPQRTVSGRLERVVADLRRTLELKGIATAAPLLNPFLADVLTSGYVAPPALRAAVTASVHNAKSGRSVRTPTGTTLTSANVLAIATVVASLAAVVVSYCWPSARVRPDAKPIAALAVEQSGQVPKQPRIEPIHRSWKFDTGEAADLKPDRGWWNHVAPTGTRPGYMEASFEVWVRLPFVAPKRPLCGTLLLRRLPKGSDLVAFGMTWSTGRTLLARTHAVPTIGKGLNNGDSLVVRIYIWDRNIVSVLDGRVISLTEYDTPFPSNQLHFSLAGVGLEKLDVDEVDEASIPSFVKEVRELKSKYRMEQHRKSELELRSTERRHISVPSDKEPNAFATDTGVVSSPALIDSSYAAGHEHATVD